MIAAEVEAREPGFSLVQGGPLYHLLRRAKLCGVALELVHRRIAAAVLLGWAPLAVLSIAQEALGRTPAIPFLADVGVHLRFLAVVPLLVLGERLVHRRLRPVVEQFAARGLVPADQQARFYDALAGAIRWRNSTVAEILMLAAVYAVGVAFTLRRYQDFEGDAWYGSGSGGVSAAGIWLVFVSLPLLQFLMLRWYFRLAIWAQFLWRVSRLDLDLNAIHPDRAGGLGFLGESLALFTPIAAAHGLLFAGMIADRILFAGASLTDFTVEIAAGTLLLVSAFAGPLLVFARRLALARRAGLSAYGLLGQAYARDFRAKWLGGAKGQEADPDEALLGSGDIQSLADLGNSYAAAEAMRFAPIDVAALARFVGWFLAPILPLVLTMMSPEKLLERLVGLVF